MTKFGNGELVEFYSWKDYSFEQFTRWKWFFKYRAALLQVKYPKYYVECNWGKIESSGRTKKDIVKARISAKKGKITQYTNKLKKFEESYTEIFPMEDNMLYNKAKAKIERLKNELKELQNLTNEN